MFGLKWPGKRLSDKETRILLTELLSTGCLLIAKLEGHINQRQNYFLLSSLYHWLNLEDGNEEHNKQVAYRLTDQLASLGGYAEDPYITRLFNDGQQLNKELRAHVIQLCMTFVVLGDRNPGNAMELIGYFCRDIGISSDVAQSLLSEAMEDHGHYRVMGYSEGYEDSLRLLQQALKRATNFN